MDKSTPIWNLFWQEFLLNYLATYKKPTAQDRLFYIRVQKDFRGQQAQWDHHYRAVCGQLGIEPYEGVNERGR